MKSIVTVHLGAAGLGVASDMWDSMKTELAPGDVSRVFAETATTPLHPLALLIDLDFDYRSSIQRNPLFSHVPYVSNSTGTGGYSMYAHYCLGKDIIDDCLTSLHSVMEQADSIDCLNIIASLSGGTGSGFTSLLLDRMEIRDISTKMFTLVLPNQETVVEPYNFVLTAANLAENTDMVVCFDNKNTGKVAEKMGMEGGLRGVNQVIAQGMTHLYAQKDSFPRSISGIATAATGDTLKFVSPSVSVNLTDGVGEMDMGDLESSLKDGCCCVNSPASPSLSSYLQFRGQWTMASVNRYLTHTNQTCEFGVYPDQRREWREWKPQTHSLFQLKAEKGFRNRLRKIAREFDVMYSKRSHVHWYVGLGMSEGEMSYSREEFHRLISSIHYMADSHDFKIEEKIRAIKETMQRLGVSFKAENEAGLVTSRSVEEREVAADLLMDTWERRPKTDMMAVRLADVVTSRHDSQDLHFSPLLPDLSSTRITELEAVIDSQKATIEQLTSDREEMKLIVANETRKIRILEQQIDEMTKNWEGLLEKCRAMDYYCKELESKAEISNFSDSHHFQLTLENTQLSNMLKIKDEELILVKNTLDQVRESLKEKEKMINEMKNKGESGEMRRLKGKLGEVVKELEGRPTKMECMVKEEQVKQLLTEISLLKARKTRTKSLGRTGPKRELKRSRSQDSQRKAGLPPLRLPSPTGRSSASTRRLSPQQGAVKTLVTLFGVKDVGGVVGEVGRVMRENKEMGEFVKAVGGLIQETSPPGAFPKSPSLSEMQNWLRRLVEEYLHLLKSSHTLVQLRSLLHVRSSSDLLSLTSKAVSDLRAYDEFLSHLRSFLSLQPQSPLSEVMDTLRVQLSR